MMRTAFVTSMKRILFSVVCGLAGTAVAHADGILLGTDYLAAPRGKGREASFLDLGPEFGGVRKLRWSSERFGAPTGMAIARRADAPEPFPATVPIELLNFDFLVMDSHGKLSVSLTAGKESTGFLELDHSFTDGGPIQGTYHAEIDLFYSVARRVRRTVEYKDFNLTIEADGFWSHEIPFIYFPDQIVVGPEGDQAANFHDPISSPNMADFFMTAAPVWRPQTGIGMVQAKSLIPEPSMLSLLGLATVALVRRRRRPA